MMALLVLVFTLTAVAQQNTCQRNKCQEANATLTTDTLKVDSSEFQAQSSEFKVQVTYTQADSLKVTQLLAEAANQEDIPEPMVYFARRLLGIPYVAHTLEVNAEEQLVVNLRQLDCTTYVETVSALTLCHSNNQRSFEDYCQWLTKLRYRQGQLTDYTSRLHYFTDWIEDNTAMRLVSETQSTQPPFNAVQTVNVGFMTANPQYYAMLKNNRAFQQIIARQEKALCGRQYRYIPKGDIANTPAMRQAVADGDIIAIVTNKKGLDTSHIGIAVWHNDGLHMLNASQIRKKTVEEPMTLRLYMSKHPSQTGIRVVKLLRNCVPEPQSAVSEP